MKKAGIAGLWLASIIAVFFAGVMATGGLPVAGTKEESRTSKVINSITRTQDVVLVSLGIQGITEETLNSTLFGWQVPGGGRTLFLQYSYAAKLGIDGSLVQIQPTGDSSIRIVIPEFKFLGHDDATFKVVVERNGVLSMVTPEIDTAQVITKILNDETKREQVQANDALLRDQARAFYSGIVTGVDPDMNVTFEFQGGAR